jgi:hypothetical protein
LTSRELHFRAAETEPYKMSAATMKTNLKPPCSKTLR